MNRFVPLFIVLSLSLIYCNTRYDDYSVVRLYGLNDTDVMELEDTGFDVWAQNKIEGWVDVMSHQKALARILQKHPNHEMKFANVQSEIDLADAAQKSAREDPNSDFFDYFPTTEEVFEYLDKAIADHPGFTRPIDIGSTYGGRPIRAIQIGSNANAPVVFFQCTIHAREWITTTTCCWMIDQLLGLDPESPELRARATWIILPILNVDGYVHTQNTRLWRKNRQPRTGSSCIGTDLNRNYGEHFGGGGSSGDPCSDTYRGQVEFDCYETYYVNEYLKSLGSRLVAFVDIHAYGAMWMSPWGWTYDYPLQPDWGEMSYYMGLAVAGLRTINGRTYASGTSANVIYIAAGGSDDWSYGGLKVVPSYTVEAFGSSFTPQPSQIAPIGREIYAGSVAMVKGIVT
jgi:hypothetical protein